MDKNGEESEHPVTARERAKRLGWRVDLPLDADPTGARERRQPRDTASDGWGRE